MSHSPRIASSWVTPRQAETAIKDKFGSVDEFVSVLLDNFPGFLDPSLDEETADFGPDVIARAFDLPVGVFLKAQQSTAFAIAMDRFAVAKAYGVRERFRSAQKLSEVAQGAMKTVMSPKGDIEQVDRSATEIIKADEHLREIQGRGVKAASSPVVGGMVVVFQQPPAKEDDDGGVTIVQEATGVVSQRGGRDVPYEQLESGGSNGEGSVSAAGVAAEGDRSASGVGSYRPPSPRAGPPPGARRAYENRGTSRVLPGEFGLGVRDEPVDAGRTNTAGSALNEDPVEYYDRAVAESKQILERQLEGYFSKKENYSKVEE